MSGSQLNCPSCHLVLRTASPVPAGRQVRCPRCAAVFKPGVKIAPAPVTAAAATTTQAAPRSGPVSPPPTPAPTIASPTPPPNRPIRPPDAPKRPRALAATCPKCKGLCRVPPTLLPGRPIKCPRCAAVFAVAIKAPRPASPAKVPAAKETKLARSQRPSHGIACPACKVVLRSVQPLRPGRVIECPKCAQHFQVARPPSSAAKPTKLAKNEAKKTQLSPAAVRRVSRMICPGCKVVLKAAGTPPAGKSLPCPHCKRPLVIAKIGTARKTKLVGAGGPRPTVLAKHAPKTRLAGPAGKPPVATARNKPASAPTASPQKARVQRAPTPPPRRRSRFYVKVALLLTMLGVLGVGGFLAYQHFLGKRDIPEAAWEEFTLPDGRCRLLMPGEPEAASATARGPGVLRAEKFTVLRNREDAGFVLSYSDRSPDALKKVAFREIAVAERDAILKSMKARMSSEADITLDGRPGYEFQGEMTGGTVLVRMYLVKGRASDRIYILLAAGSHVRAGQGDAAKFFDSFKVSAPPE